MRMIIYVLKFYFSSLLNEIMDMCNGYVFDYLIMLSKRIIIIFKTVLKPYFKI